MKPSPRFIVLLATLAGVSSLVAQSPVTTVSAAVTAGAVAVTPANVTTVTVLPPVPPPTVAVTPVVPVTLPPAGSASEARLINLSTRARVTATSPLIAGFAISGTSPRPVLVRAAGPALVGFGVNGALGAPRLELRAATGALLAENTGWADAIAIGTAAAQSGAFPFARGSADSAIVVTLAPGIYTAQVTDATGGSGGVALAEIYDLGGLTGDSRLANVSVRATVAANGGELISGFVLAGTASRNFLVRGVGPGLAKFGVTGTLTNPGVALFDTASRQLAANDDWSGNNQVAVVAATVAGGSSSSGTSAVTPSVNADLVRSAAKIVGAFDLDLVSYDAAFVTTLAPGAYTVQVTGNSTVSVSTVATGGSASGSTSGGAVGTTGAVTATLTIVPPSPGVALLELYEVP